MRLAHSQMVYMIFLHTLLLCQIFRWGRYSDGAHREGEALTPSTSPAYVLSAYTLACSPARSWLLLLGPCSFSLDPRLRGWHLLLQASCVRAAGVSCCSHHILPVACFSLSRAVIRGGSSTQEQYVFSQMSGYPELIYFLFVKVQTFLCPYNKQLLAWGRERRRI